MKKLIYIFVLFFCFSCINSEKKEISRIVSYWQNREIKFPVDTSFISYSRRWGEQKVSLEKGEYAILSYVDSTGCMSCKLQLPEWNKFICMVDSISYGTVPFIFVFQSKTKQDLVHFLKKTGFEYPVYIDENDNFGQLNKFPSNMQLQTFLLDKNNKVLAIGNPVHNPKIKELYLNIIQGKKDVEGEKTLRTEITIKEPIISLGHFNWKEEKKTAFKIENTGKYPLIINDVTTSCGCTSVNYSKEPVRPGDSISLQVTYKADHPEHFDKTITVYCNANPSLVHLKIMGDAE